VDRTGVRDPEAFQTMVVGHIPPSASPIFQNGTRAASLPGIQTGRQRVVGINAENFEADAHSITICPRGAADFLRRVAHGRVDARPAGRCCGSAVAGAGRPRARNAKMASSASEVDAETARARVELLVANCTSAAGSVIATLHLGRATLRRGRVYPWAVSSPPLPVYDARVTSQ
jgi:hypothetical protein